MALLCVVATNDAIFLVSFRQDKNARDKDCQEYDFLPERKSIHGMHASLTTCYYIQHL
jgi:hypothetical protein